MNKLRQEQSDHQSRPAAERMPDILVHAKHRRRSNAPLQRSQIASEKLRRPAKGFALLASGAFAVMAVVGPYSIGATAASAAPVVKHLKTGDQPQADPTPDDATDDDSQTLAVSDDSDSVNLDRDDAKAKDAAPVPDGAATPASGSPKEYAASQIAKRGWSANNYTCLVKLWNRESGWRTSAANPSGAYGIPQALPGSKMSSAGPDWKHNAHTQIDWGLGYIAGRYGTPCGAWGHSQSTGWY